MWYVLLFWRFLSVPQLCQTVIASLHHFIISSFSNLMISLQGDYVRKLKESKESDNELARAVAELKLRKRVLEDKVRRGLVMGSWQSDAD